LKGHWRNSRALANPTGTAPSAPTAAGCSGDGKRAGIGPGNGVAEESDGSAVLTRQRHFFRGTGVIETLSTESEARRRSCRL
jgi:hypothetical protein